MESLKVNQLGGKEQNEDDAERVKNDSTNSDAPIEKDDLPQQVKSTAVVKYSAVNVPGTFARLQCNTDLKLPPSNWLNSSAESYGLQHVLCHSKGFSSFRMAHMFPDCVSEVDVISDAENIKKLLKIPYSREPVSMMVHCVEKTLLIDEFDIHKHLLRTAESDWEWLRKFFYDHVLQTLNTKEKCFPPKNKSRYALQQKSLISKFLHHSLEEPESPVAAPAPPESKTAMTWPPLPEPSVEEELPDPAIDHTYNRNVVWTFEDIQMLLGTDMPIFGGSTHPCISLRLRDMTKPISVLTGIDYWLDNLMSNVPEVVMCYHLDGIVQRYELIKTEELPKMKDSKFSPKIIRDVAQNILSFLKSNATKAGHTYWLFKGKNEDVVKLYDLTCLCSESLVDKGQNPFTIPVAMLLYRVARNMKHSANNTKTVQPGTIRVLLKNCLSLLPKEKYPQIVTSAHYMLSDLYVPVNTDPACPCLDDEPLCTKPQEEEEEEEEEEHGEEFSNAIKTLCISDFKQKNNSKYVPPPTLGGSLEERCCQALDHVVAGLQCLQYFESQTFSSETMEQEMGDEASGVETNEPQMRPKMARPFQAIPMPYAPLGDSNIFVEPEQQKEKTSKKKSRKKRNDLKSSSGKKNVESGDGETHNDQAPSHSWDADTSPKALLCKERAVPLPTWQQPENMDSAAWHAHLKTLLYEKACLVYTTLAEKAYSSKKFGRALRYIKYVLRCHAHMSWASGQKVNTNKAPAKGFVSYLLGRAGDCYIQLAQSWDEVSSHREDFAMAAPVDQTLEGEMDKDVKEEEYHHGKFVPDVISDMEQILHASFNCYEQALSIDPSDNFRRRLGNVHNELGAFYMNQIALGQGTDNEVYDAEQFEALFKTAQQHLNKGQAQFEAANDCANLALLQSNHGRLMRLFAHYNHPVDRKEVSVVEKQYYVKALDCYKKALAVLKNRKNNPLVWDSIMWEMSTTLNTMATLYQDYPPAASDLKSQEEHEREVIDLLTKALQSCDLETQSFRLPIYQFRAATLNYRIGSFYHHAYRNILPEDCRRKSYLHLAQLHYERSCQNMEVLEHPVEFLRMQLERVALQEYVAESSGFSTKIKALQSALDILIKTRPIIVELAEREETRHKNEGPVDEEEPNKQKENTEENEEEINLLILFEKRLQFVLRSLCLLGQQHKLSLLPKYKEMYSQVLKQQEDKSLVDHLRTVLAKFEEFIRKGR